MTHTTSPVLPAFRTQETQKASQIREDNALLAAPSTKSYDATDIRGPSSEETSSSTSSLFSAFGLPSGPRRETRQGLLWPPSGNTRRTQNKRDTPSLSPHPSLSLPLVPLDPLMQAYFFRMWLLARGTCDPRHIREEAQTISSLFFDEDKENNGVEGWAQRLFFAAIAQVHYTRSMAILIVELLDEVKDTSEQLSEDLRLALVEIVSAAFQCSWNQVRTILVTCVRMKTDLHIQTDLRPLDGLTGIDSIHPMFELLRSHLLSIVALAGDLYSLGVLPATDMCQMASLLVFDLRTLTHTRALHLLLLRASTSARQALPVSLLQLWRERLICLARGWGIFFVRDVTRRWVIVSEPTLCESFAVVD